MYMSVLVQLRCENYFVNIIAANPDISVNANMSLFFLLNLNSIYRDYKKVNNHTC